MHLIISMAVDETDEKILNALKKNSNTSYREIASSLGISDVAVHKRIKKMEKEGVIKRFTVLVSQEAVDKHACAIITIKCDAGRAKEIAGEIAKIKDVKEVYIAIGSYDIIAKIRTKDTNALKDIIEKSVRMIKGIHEIRTSIIFESTKEEINEVF